MTTETSSTLLLLSSIFFSSRSEMGPPAPALLRRPKAYFILHVLMFMLSDLPSATAFTPMPMPISSRSHYLALPLYALLHLVALPVFGGRRASPH